jgi:DNA-binding IclR family transcriptional regulator
MARGALERAARLLERLGEDKAEPTVPELAGEAGVPTSTAYRLLAELEQYGLVERRADGTVVLGARMVVLGRTAQESLRRRLVDPARRPMERLTEAVGETTILTVPCGLEAIVLHAVETERHSVRLSYALYRRAPIHRGASGKILAAHLETAERERLVQAVDGTTLAAELAEIRRDGVAMTTGELDPGAAAVAAPILDRRGEISAGLSIAGPVGRITAERESLRESVVACAAMIQRAYQG